MDDALFPQYSAEGRDLIRKAYDVAEKALAGETRSNGAPFFSHPRAVAKIAASEIGLRLSVSPPCSCTRPRGAGKWTWISMP